MHSIPESWVSLEMEPAPRFRCARCGNEERCPLAGSADLDTAARRFVELHRECGIPIVNAVRRPAAFWMRGESREVLIVLRCHYCQKQHKHGLGLKSSATGELRAADCGPGRVYRLRELAGGAGYEGDR